MGTCTKCGEAFTAMDWTGSDGLCVKCYFSCPREIINLAKMADTRARSVDYKALEEQAVARMKRPTERERAKEPEGFGALLLNEAHQRTIDRKRTLLLADKLFRFCCGLNMQDHPVAEQRELRDLLRQLGPLLSTKGDR